MVRVRSQPQLDAPWHCAEKVFECRRVPFAVNPVQIRGALRRTLALVITVLLGVPFAFFVAPHAFPFSRGDRGVLEQVMMPTDND